MEQDEEIFQPEQVVGQRPGAEGFTDDGHFVSVACLEQANGLQDRAGGRAVEEIGGDGDLFRLLVEVAAVRKRSDRGHAVFGPPIHVRPQRRRLLDDREIGCDGVVVQQLVSGGCQLRHLGGVVVDFRKEAARRFHQVHGGDGSRVADARAVDRLTLQRPQKTLFGGHHAHSPRVRMSSAMFFASWASQRNRLSRKC